MIADAADSFEVKLKPLRYGPSLKNKSFLQFVAQEATKSIGDQVDLSEELAIIRHIAAQAIETYSMALTQAEEKPNDHNYRNMVMLAANMVHQALREVKQTIETIMRIQTSRAVQISPIVVHGFTSQLESRINELCARDHSLLGQEIVREMNTLAATKVIDAGVVSTPASNLEDVVLSMDKTVPAIVDE